jgi:peptidoglycan/LPS O-acetylase OafA/YrhL
MLQPLTTAVPGLPTFIEGAYFALGTFFMISGFVLTLRYRTTEWTGVAAARYASARFARIYPLYLLSLAVVAPIISASMRTDEVGSAGERLWYLANYLLLLQGWQRPPVDWNTPAWSLSCEIFFYACFPALIVTLRRLSRAHVLVLSAAAFAIPVGVRMLGVPTTVKPLIYFGDFVLGMAAAGVYEMLRERLSGRGSWLYLPAFAAGIALLFTGGYGMPFLVYDTALRAANGALVLGLAAGGGVVWRLLSSPTVVAGGAASYAIYILHIPALWWYRRYAPELAIGLVPAGLIYLAGVIAVSMVIWRFYEQPAGALVRSKLEQRVMRRSSAPTTEEAMQLTAPRRM